MDALLAASAYSENIAVFFIGEGVTQLVANQNTTSIYSRDYAAAFKLMALYDIHDVYICAQSIKAQGLAVAQWIIDAQPLTQEALNAQLHSCDKLLTF